MLSEREKHLVCSSWTQRLGWFMRATLYLRPGTLQMLCWWWNFTGVGSKSAVVPSLWAALTRSHISEHLWLCTWICLATFSADLWERNSPFGLSVSCDSEAPRDRQEAGLTSINLLCPVERGINSVKNKGLIFSSQWMMGDS